MKKLIMLFLVMVMAFSSTACGGPDDSENKETINPNAETVVDVDGKEAFKDYINNHLAVNSGPKNDEIVNRYLAAVETGDGDVLVEVLREILILNAYLYEELESYVAETDEILNLHNIFFEAVSKRELAYVSILSVLTDLEAEKEDITAAFDLLDESIILFNDYMVKVGEIKASYGY